MKPSKTSGKTGEGTVSSAPAPDIETEDWRIDRSFEFGDRLAFDPAEATKDVIIIGLDYDLITTILTRERIRMVNHLRSHGPYASLQKLADDLGRDKTAVSRDLKRLEGGLVEVEKVGRRKRIWAPDKPVILY